MKSVWKRLALGVAALGLIITGTVASNAQEPTIIAVTHGQASDPFWSIVKNGITQAGKDSDVRVDYRAPETFDMVAMGQLIEAAANQQPAGIVISGCPRAVDRKGCRRRHSGYLDELRHRRRGKARHPATCRSG